MPVLALLAVAAMATAASATAKADRTGAAAASAACERPRIGFMGPITGDAAFIGKEQLGFARYAIRTLARGRMRLVETDTRFNPARAATIAAELHANEQVLAVVGPATNREVLAAARSFRKAPRLTFVSASALSSSLTNGSIPNFFRVVPSDSVQAPSTARYILRVLKARQVFIVDDQTAYSRLLADEVQTRLRAGGVRVTRNSVSQKMTDFTSLVAKIRDRFDLVYLPWQIAANGQVFGEQLRGHGKRTIIFGSDGLDSGDFKIPGSYVAAFAPDIRGIAGNAAFVSGYGARFVSTFGPPMYVATQAVIKAIEKACADGGATRAEVQKNVRTTVIPKIVLGGSLEFTETGDRKGARFSIFKLGAGGKKRLVG